MQQTSASLSLQRRAGVACHVKFYSGIARVSRQRHGKKSGPERLRAAEEQGKLLLGRDGHGFHHNRFDRLVARTGLHLAEFLQHVSA